MLIGADSWFPPDQRVINALKVLDGFSFYGGYVGGEGLYLQTPWPQSAWDLLKQNNVKPLPIWVPKQDCSENPTEQAQLAIAAVEKYGMTGMVALDTEHSMSAIMNFGAWIDEFNKSINEAGWHCVDYAGAGYLSPLAFHWVVMWGEHEEVPLPGSAIQYGPYTLRDTNGDVLMQVDADSADENFVFAEWIGNTSQTNGGSNEPVSNVTEPSNDLPTISDSHEEPSADPKVTLTAPVVASAMLPGKVGAVSVGADGGVFCYGAAKNHGSIPEMKLDLHAPIVALELIDNNGYTLVAADGGRFSFGDDPGFPPV